MGALWSGEEVITKVYGQLVQRYQPETVVLPKKISLLVGRKSDYLGTQLYLAYQRFGLFKFNNDASSSSNSFTKEYWVIGKGEPVSNRNDQRYAADLLGVRLQRSETRLTGSKAIPQYFHQELYQYLRSDLPRFSHLSQSLIQASTTGALMFNSRLSQFIASRVKEIISLYIVHAGNRQFKSTEFNSLEIKYRPERDISEFSNLAEEREEEITGEENKTSEYIDGDDNDDAGDDNSEVFHGQRSSEKRRIESELSLIIAKCLMRMR